MKIKLGKRSMGAYLMEGGAVSGDFGVKGLLDESPPLNLGLTLLNLGHDSVNILESTL
jgi:hypothetical protein